MTTTAPTARRAVCASFDPLGTAQLVRSHSGTALFSYGFRPFFLGASIWAALAIPIWTLAYVGIAPAGFAARDWHTHEMLFGYLGGVIGGFVLTAAPNWTGRLPVVGAPLIGLFGLWMAGRAAMLAQGWLGPIAATVDSAYLVALALVIWREVLAGGNIRNIPVCVLVSLLAAANIAFHLHVPAPGAQWAGERLAIAVGALLVALIGGRITPSFTRNWMAKRGLTTPEPHATDRFDAGALVLTAAALIVWLAAPLSVIAGAGLIAAGLALLARLARWRGWATASEPLVLILHVGYLWLAAGVLLMGLAALTPAAFPPSAGVHALTAGAFGTMTLAVMTRATRGHTGRPLTADRTTQAIYLLVTLGGLGRVAAGLAAPAYMALLILSSLLWSGAFLLFVLAYGPMLATRRASAAMSPP